MDSETFRRYGHDVIAAAREHVEQAWQALREMAAQGRSEGRRKS